MLSQVKPIIIENVSPEINSGQFAAKWTQYKPLFVEADIFKDGHDVIKANLKYKKKSEENWQTSPLKATYNDHWLGSFTPNTNTYYQFTIEAWFDPLCTWHGELKKKNEAGIIVSSEVLEGIKLLKLLFEQIKSSEDNLTNIELINLLTASRGEVQAVKEILSEAKYLQLIEKYPIKLLLSEYDKVLEVFVDRPLAEFSSWYEFFPRSQGESIEQHGTFKDCIDKLPYVNKLGFNVLYLPPIHPIGQTFRKGKNNSLKAEAHEPGSPWGIGSSEGGHKAIHPELGTFEDFENFVHAAKKLDIEIALDIAFQCSPDHPYVQEHPEWFYQLPDGTIKYAENPPKKYQDIYPINFHCDNYKELWEELRSVFIFWIEKGIKIFRVDNPHTKPLPFWDFVMRDIREKHPEVIFLSEAFTIPKMMKYLAKVGFNQSYTYFTWRNTKHELSEYLNELTKSEMKYYFKGNFFATTPDILPKFLQTGGKAAFEIRLILAATLCSNYGIYQGYEICENTPFKEDSEEYLNSEKYEIKHRNFEQAGNIVDLICKINSIRSSNNALQIYDNIEFYHSNNENILCYGKRTADNSNIIVVVINLDPFNPQDDTITLPLEKFGIEDWETYKVTDLLGNANYEWKGKSNYIRLDPNHQVAHVFELRK